MKEQGNRPKPILTANPYNLGNLFFAVVDSPIFRTRIHIGTLDSDGRAVKTKKETIKVDRANAQPGQKVIVHEVV